MESFAELEKASKTEISNFLKDDMTLDDFLTKLFDIFPKFKNIGEMENKKKRIQYIERNEKKIKSFLKQARLGSYEKLLETIRERKMKELVDDPERIIVYQDDEKPDVKDELKKQKMKYNGKETNAMLKKKLDKISEHEEKTMKEKIEKKLGNLSKDESQRLMKGDGILANLYKQLPLELIKITIAGFGGATIAGIVKEIENLEQDIQKTIRAGIKHPSKRSHEVKIINTYHNHNLRK